MSEAGGGWDGHVHVFDASAPSIAGHYRPVDRPLSQIEAIAECQGVEHLVLVQPSVYGTDNGVMLRALAAMPGRHRGVAVVPDDIADAELDAMHACGVRGIRFNRVSPVGEDRDPAKRFAALAPRLRRLGWHVQWYAGIDDLSLVASLHHDSGVIAVVDHLAGFASGIESDHPAWRVAEALAAQGAWIKLSGWYRLDAEAPYTSLLPQIRRLADLFQDHMVWGLGLAAHGLRARRAAAVRDDVATGRGCARRRGGPTTAATSTRRLRLSRVRRHHTSRMRP